MSLTAIQRFFKLESASGIMLIIMAFLAMGLANSPLADTYDSLLDTRASIALGSFDIDKPILLWINDGLMAIFFLVIGLEVKREMRQGELANPAQIMLPGLAAAGGLLMPTLVYAAFNWGDSVAMEGWAIPVATDIAFALGILYLLGDRVPSALKLFLLTLAIFDDLAAISIIAIFYTSDLAVEMLLGAAVILIILIGLNRSGVKALTPYLLLGIALWVLVLKSGVHATLAGVALAFTIPLKGAETDRAHSPLEQLEHTLHPYVAYAILPLFALANAGVSLRGVSVDTLLDPVPLGITAGLVVGKQLGVFGFSWAAIRLGIARLPDGVSWFELYGVAALAGIGFTMSLFIGSLAFEHGATDYAMLNRLGILTGSLISAIYGYGVLRLATARRMKTRRVHPYPESILSS